MAKRLLKRLLIGATIVVLLALAAVFVYNYAKERSVWTSPVSFSGKGKMINFNQEFRINKGERVTIGDELSFEFLYHSHKTVYPGQTSPLIIGLAFLDAEGIKKEESVNLFPETDRTWTRGKYRFELRDYEYDKYMVLVVEKEEKR